MTAAPNDVAALMMTALPNDSRLRRIAFTRCGPSETTKGSEVVNKFTVKLLRSEVVRLRSQRSCVLHTQLSNLYLLENGSTTRQRRASLGVAVFTCRKAYFTHAVRFTVFMRCGPTHTTKVLPTKQSPHRRDAPKKRLEVVCCHRNPG